MKNFYITLFSLLCLLIVVGCTGSRNTIAEKNIREVITTQFTSADKELISLWSEQHINSEKLDTYLANTYQQYFSDNAYDSFISGDGLLYQIAAANSEYHMFIDSISITETESNHSSYKISVIVNYQKDEEPLQSATVTGFVSVSKEGKITRINIIDDGNLYTTFITGL